MCPRSDPLKHVFFLKGDGEFPQHTQVLAFERLICMVLPLFEDVSDDSVELRPGIREWAIALSAKNLPLTQPFLLIHSLL